VHSANTEKKKEGRVTAASVVAEEKSITNEEGRLKVFQKKFSLQLSVVAAAAAAAAAVHLVFAIFIGPFICN
jgi:hypothetical protein